MANCASNEALTGGDFTLSMWFWLGEASGASQRSGNLCTFPSGARLVAMQDQQHRVQAPLGGQARGGRGPKARPKSTSKDKWKGMGKVTYADDWHNVTVVARVMMGSDIGRKRREVAATGSVKDIRDSGAIEFGERLQGKLDEIALFDRALDDVTIRSLWQASSMELEHKRKQFARQRAIATNSPSEQPLKSTVPAKFAATYSASIDALRPVNVAAMAEPPFHFPTYAKDGLLCH